MTTSTDECQALLDEHGAALLLFARQRVASLVDAEDALQEVFICFWRSRDHVRDPLSYLYSCVRTAALDLRRGAHRRQRRESLAARSANAAWFDTSVGEADRRETIEHALTGLPVDQREALVMRIWSGATFQQIGEALGVSSKTASARYGSAVDSLCTLVSEDLVQ
ncbi:MAG: sigma-70 family RNA polymerase sigma factor [Pirellulaceae bacterium]|jgi:RNA polymerase sigma-70 factor (ECF subfamily)|nr:sigma-70 family RNA polymerase sigma factor [Pirellulaceae bacterium]HJN08654.1 sigma-70 family RNA polymerase sigma factor [Pirellulaceae bacterium]